MASIARNARGPETETACVASGGGEMSSFEARTKAGAFGSQQGSPVPPPPPTHPPLLLSLLYLCVVVSLYFTPAGKLHFCNRNHESRLA